MKPLKLLLLYDGTLSSKHQCVALASAIRRNAELANVYVSDSTVVKCVLQRSYLRIHPLLHATLLACSNFLNSFNVGYTKHVSNPVAGYQCYQQIAEGNEKIWKMNQVFDEHSPNMIIACGRRTAPLNFALSRYVFNNNPINVQINHPRCGRVGNAYMFDKIVTPLHDLQSASFKKRKNFRFSDDLYIALLGSLSRVTTQSLQNSMAIWSDTDRLKFCGSSLTKDSDNQKFKNLIVLFGGVRHGKISSGVLKNCLSESQKLGNSLLKITSAMNAIQENPWRVTIICSRRTPKVCIDNFRALSKQNETIQLWTMDDDEQNPYEASLAFGDVFLVTSDSVSMTCDACSTGKPVFTVSFLSSPTKSLQRYLFRSKFDYFHTQMQRIGYTKDFDFEQLKECLVKIGQSNESSLKLRDADEAARTLLFSQTFEKCI